MNWTAYTFTMLGLFFVVFGWGVFTVVRRAWRRHEPVLGKELGRAVRWMIVAVLIVGAFYEFYVVFAAITDGEIRVPTHGRAAHGHTDFRAIDPAGFWETVCVVSYTGLVFFYISVSDIIIAIRANKRARGPHLH